MAHRLQRLRTEFENCSDSYAQITQAASAAPVRGSLETVRDLASQLSLDSTMPLEVSNYLANGNADAFASHDATDTDYLMVYSAEYGADILQRGKDDLMKRLEPFAEGREQNAPAGTGQAPHEPRDTAQLPPARNGHLILPRTADYFSEAESEEEDCGIPGDDGRGLLTDVPLILGPNEIEVLPMIILSGIVPPPSVSTPGYGSTPEETLAVRNMHTVRCHFFLAQDNGRNLLRELLIFVAAWDLREDELYFKFMVKIMESILNNDLMPFSYHAFRESKDIISPAQAVIMKLLTNIFRLRQARYQQETARAPQENDAPAQYPTRVDVHMVNFLLTEFRRHIIPQTCALIFLQGQIRAGHASPEDFPLNLWDMERMYEGIYQYLEFFAILTECDAWKQMMAEWDVTSELVTLLKELDAAIPRSTLAREMSKIPSALKQPPPVLPAMPQPPPQPEPINAQAPVSVERPYDVTSPVGPGMPESTLSFHQPTAAPVSGAAGPPHDDEPSDFPWKNLKKLTVLVLSSLTWKSQRVQDQVREHDGIKVVLNCIKHDDFNPYIREHAIMALRFLVEGNDANREVVRALEARAAETARAKGVAAAAGASASAGRRRGANPKAVVPPGGSDATNGAEAKGAPLPTGGLFDLMKEVMREMPARVRGQALDKHKTDLLRQLDREFD
ncbi:MAG: hypothetical protein INR71_07495 [Terriglobus roseus]|nr:hypothetical protein [Terriglobus roseus]